MDENRLDEYELDELAEDDADLDELAEDDADLDELSAWDQLKAYSNIIILLGLVGVMAALVSFAWLGQINIIGQVLLVVGLLLVILYIVLEPRLVQSAATARQTRYGLNAVIMSLAFVGIVLLINVVLYKYNARMDYTAGQQYSISQQSVKILSNLTQDVHLVAFIREVDGREPLEDLLKEYVRHAPAGRFTYEFVDPDLHPERTNQYGITRYGTLVFESGGERRDTFGATEQDITGAILKVTLGEVKRIYYLTGHKELSLDDTAENGYSQAKAALESNNYEVVSLNLLISGTVPADAAVVVLASPGTPLGDQEATALTTYARNGGKLFLLVDPEQVIGIEAALQQDYGVFFENDVVIDPVNSIQGSPLMPVILQYTSSDITNDLGLTFFPWSRSVSQTLAAPDGVTVQSLFKTSNQSWGETDFANANPTFDPTADVPGPMSLCLTVEQEETAIGGGARLVLMGNASFATNQVFDQQSNGDLFVNCVNWLAKDEALISIRPKPPVDNRMDLAPYQVPLVVFSSLCLLPLLIMGLGALVWWRRR
ncbi:MAG: GldG family protein [Chloroflexi bacterium]|nr:GldG family protein [Chloroflexota bacterium]MBU1747657.1 GldG family protein [Chloroflexota bacterium]